MNGGGGKRKGGRGGGGGGNNSSGRNDRSAPPKQTKTPDKEAAPDTNAKADEFTGVFSNPRFTHAMTTLIGTHLRVETKSKEEYEGVLKCFSPQFDIVLGLSHKIDPECPDIVNVQSIEPQIVFPIKTVVRFYATDVDLDFGVKETFQTDTQISQAKQNGEAPMRELEMWMPEDDGGEAIEDDLTSNNGWSAHDMFAKNEERFGLKTSYDPQMSAYTTTLNKDRIDGETAEKAARIAASIEGESRSRTAAELENGDEEEAFSAVVRPGDKRHGRERESPGDDKTSAYVPPGKREARGGGYSRGGRGGHGQRTPPPRSYDGYDDHRQRDDRRDRYSGGGGDRRGDRSHRDSYSERHHGGDRGYHREERSYGRQDSHGKKDDYRGQKDDYRSPKDDYRGSKDDYRGQKDDYRGQKDDYRGPSSFDPHRSGNSYQDQHRGGQIGGGAGGNRPPSARDERKSSEKVSPLPPLSAEEKAERRKSSEMNRSPAEAEAGGGGLPQRDSRRKPEKSKEQSTAELQNFHQNFNLKIGDSSGSSPPQAQPSTPSVSINPEAAGSNPAPSPGAARDNKTPTPRPSPKPTTPTQANPSTSPTDKGKPPPSPSTSTFTLNPNAKEFSLNPTAKEFTPRMPPRPSATPPRPQTPATPQNMGPMYAAQTLIPVQGVPPQHMQIPFNSSASTSHQRPMRPNSKDGHIRPDLPSPMQVQQVTGQPILAHQIHQPTQYLPPGAGMQYVQQGHGGPFVRMMVPPGIMPANLVHVPLSSGQAPAGTAQAGAPPPPPAAAGGEQPPPPQQQQFVPATSQYAGNQAAPPPQHMWTPQVITTPSPLQQQQQPPAAPHPQHTMAGHPHNTNATPPAPAPAPPPGQTGHTPAPSPGPQIIAGYPQSHSQPNSLHQHQYPMIIMPSGGLPQFHQGPIPAGPPIPGGGQMMAAGQPATSQYNVPFQYMQGGPIQMMPQHPHPNQNQNTHQ